MALWLARAGKRGEHETKFLEDKKIYVCWDGLNRDLSKFESQKQLTAFLCTHYPSFKPKKCIHHASQLWPFVRDMKIGDWMVVPSKRKPAIHVAEITGDYVFVGTAADPYYHYRSVKWIANDVPRSIFDQDLLYSLGAFMTFCRIERNDAEKRFRTLAAAGWKGAKPQSNFENIATSEVDPESLDDEIDLERLGRDQIAKAIIAQFKGHGLARLVEAILQAQGYSTYRSPEGPDKGVDILAAPGPLGFGTPRICVQVKSSDGPVDAPTLNNLIGAMQNVNASQGLLVSWGGFKSSVDREAPTQFFKVRLWDQDDLIKELLAHYDRLDEEMRAELPLKRIWTVALQDEEQ